MRHRSFTAKLPLALVAGGLAWNGAAAQETGLAEVVITGSRVITNGNESPTPVTVVTVDDIQATRPTTVFEGLLDMPQFAGSRGAVTNPGAAGATNNNISALSLRGLGQQRTLILYDGHRVPPTQQDGYVNANMIPQMLLQRVDVVTGGVSAVYGSDGISGVVNFITDRKFNGLKANVQYGVSEQNDDKSYEIGVAGGMNLFGGRGHIEGSYQTHDDDGILLRTARQFGRERWTLQGDGSAARPYFMVPYATISNTTFGGKITAPASGSGGANPYLNQQFVAPGVLGPFVPGSTDGVVGNIQIGGDGAYHTSTSLKAQLSFHQLYGRFDFDITDTLHWYTTVAGTLEHSLVYNQDTQLSNATLRSTNAYLAQAYQQQLLSRNITTFTFNKMWTLDSVGPTAADNYTRQYLLNTGLEGSLGDFKWEAWYTHGLAREDNRQINAIDNGRLAAALDATQVTSGNVGSTGLPIGSIVCNVALTNPGLYPGCVPMNVFGLNTESRDAINYIIRPTQYKPEMKMDDVAASISGAPFNTWAGPVNMALSPEWRKLVYELESNSLPVAYDPLSCTGITLNCVTYNPTTGVGTSKVSSSLASRSPVSQTVIEAAIEADVPLLKGVPAVESLNLNTAYRYARYTVTGSPLPTVPSTTHNFSANTWKVGLDWNIIDPLRIRATRSRDFRAPNLSDLYAPGGLTADTRIDFLTGRNPPSAVLQSGGNPNLIPEIGYTTTVGIVWTANEKFSMSLDGYDITVRNAITNANGYAPNVQNACYASGGSSYYCTLQERGANSIPSVIAAYNANPAAVIGNAAYDITKYYSIPVNIAEQRTWGADIEANYRSRRFDHAFSLRGLVSYQPHIVLSLPGAVTTDFAGVDFSNQNQGGAVWRASLFARFGVTDNFTIDWLTRWRSALHHNSDAALIVGRGDPNRNPPVAFSNVNFSYKLAGDWGEGTLYFNVQNVFNQQPTPAASAGPQGAPGNFGGYAPGDDPIGRYYSVGVRYRM